MSEKPQYTIHEKRVAVFKLLFAMAFGDDPNETYISFLYDEDGDGNRIINREYSSKYVSDTYCGVCARLDEIDRIIGENAKNWSMERMSYPTKTILRLSVYELLFGKVPPKVAINEAVEIIKEYDDSGAPAFVNGILNRIARTNGLIPDMPPRTKEAE